MRLLPHIRNGLSHYTSAATLQGVCQKVVKGKEHIYITIYISLQPYAAKLLNAFGILKKLKNEWFTKYNFMKTYKYLIKVQNERNTKFNTL